MSNTPLRDRFDAMLCGKPPISDGMRKALLEAFMAGAAAHDNIIIEALEGGADGRRLAAICDAMVGEMKKRHE